MNIMKTKKQRLKAVFLTFILSALIIAAACKASERQEPDAAASKAPIAAATDEQREKLTAAPTEEPEPTDAPTEEPTAEPTAEPEPTEEPPAIPTKIPYAEATEIPTAMPYLGELPEAPFESPVTDLAFHWFDADALSANNRPELGFFEVIYRDDNMVIFFGSEGLFLFDFEKEKITLNVDFLRLFNEYGGFQGSFIPLSAAVSADGEYVQIDHGLSDRNDQIISLDKLYIHIPSMTYIRGDYGNFEAYWDWYEHGQPTISGPYNETTITNGDKKYLAFADTSFVVDED